MAVPGGELQMINGQGKFFETEAESFVQGLPQNCLYSVISIIGPQSSGKSSLLNSVFRTNFEVLNARKRQGRKQTTKGIWIAKCNNPCMIIMDVEGMDGMENRGNRLFERQSALFALAISDVMMLNMWYKDIGREDGAGLGLLKLIFLERVKMDAPITEIIVVVRDHDYDQLDASVTEQNVQGIITELWKEVHRDAKLMSDYIKVTVKDFPHKKEEIFAQKSDDLRNLLQTATNGMSHAPSFAYLSKMIWDKILRNEVLIASEQKRAMSTHVCHHFMNLTLMSLDQEPEYKSLMEEDTTIRDFSAMLNSFVTRLLEWYDQATVTWDADRRKGIRDELESRIVQRFAEPFDLKAEQISYTMSKAFESSFLDIVNKLRVEGWESSALSKVITDYHDRIDRLYPKDVHRNLEWILAKYLDLFVKRSTELLEMKCKEIIAEQAKQLIEEIEARETAEIKAREIIAEKIAREISEEKKAAKIKGKRNLVKSIVKIAAGTAWAAFTFDPSMLFTGIAGAASSALSTAAAAVMDVIDK